jgi:hypothetical protein
MVTGLEDALVVETVLESEVLTTVIVSLPCPVTVENETEIEVVELAVKVSIGIASGALLTVIERGEDAAETL